MWNQIIDLSVVSELAMTKKKKCNMVNECSTTSSHSSTEMEAKDWRVSAAWAPVLIRQLYTCFTKTAARYPARRKKNLRWQRPVIFTRSDSWTARSQSPWAPQASRQRPMFSLLLMQNRWDFFRQLLRLLLKSGTFCLQKLHGQSQYLNSYMTSEHKWKRCWCPHWGVCCSLDGKQKCCWMLFADWIICCLLD